MIVTAYVLMDLNNAIANNEGFFPYYIERHYRNLRKMLRRTYTIMSRKAVKEHRRIFHNMRYNCYITRDRTFASNKDFIFYNLERAMHVLSLNDRNISIIGGESIFKQTFDYCDRIVVTEVQLIIDNPYHYFPKIDLAEWKLVSSKELNVNLMNHQPCIQKIYERIVEPQEEIL
jgi:dihydrofolate reductase